MRQLSIVFVLFLFYSCNEHFKENELYGFYAPVGYKNNFDTIELKPKGVYHRKVYDKNNKLVLEMNGRWKFENNHIVHFEPFYLNLDDDLIKFPNVTKDTSGGWRGSFKTHKGKIQFCVGYHQGENCYCKVK